VGFAFTTTNIKIFAFLEMEQLKKSETCLDPSLGLDQSMNVIQVQIHLLTQHL
jgi:hypothetical protein